MQPLACSFRHKEGGSSLSATNPNNKISMIARFDIKIVTYSIADTPACDGNASRLVEAGPENCGVVVGGSTLDIELGDGNLATGSGEGVDGSSGSTCSVGLRHGSERSRG